MKNRIGELRREKGLTLKKMGEELKIRDNTLSQYETGKREPQLGTMQEIADFFNVSLEYLMGKSDKRDYKIVTHEDAINLLEKIHSKEIKYSDLSRNTSINLAFWIASQFDLIKNEYPHLSTTALRLTNRVQMESETMEWYIDLRKSNSEKINQIIDLLENDDEYYGATPGQILEFMKQSARIDYDEIEKILDYMKKLPSIDDTVE
ncbi:helix-turn-helix transcriptional regulator [Vagococcus lutrae]|uniref:helix-turn-helix domain-containing protein n=1 Tax=Vagococcus lutrae TaxID=81947 RepID=UPI00232E4D7D|nr:helix-turn-helix transcriptional regulator [Vagococcus lutrae]MDT2818874.1 helix-turn-helix transcriptional regulator [Vagococcus lutrae]MDT2843559.1 helix-turn-helix transcriptional regulator [Vagococcus lutrae]WCG04446.1 helix-turn-helix transcriptional regulator [Vagococcus lutrae]